MIDPTVLATRLREIADDPAWPGWYRAEAKSWGAEGLTPVSLSDDDIREALRARMLARPVDRSTPLTREWLDEWLAKQAAKDAGQ